MPADEQHAMVITNLLLRGPKHLWIVYVVAFLQSCMGQFFGPAENALLPRLVDPDRLLTANSLNALNNNLARLAGPAIGGMVVATLGLRGVALVDAATFVIAAAMIALIRVQPRHVDDDANAVPAAVSPAAVWREWRDGLRLVRQERVLRVLFAVTAIIAVGEGALSVLFVPWVQEALHGEALQLGWLMSAQGIGGLLGGVAIAKLGERVHPLRMLAPSLLLFGLIDLVIFISPVFVPSLALALTLFVLVGLRIAGANASMSTLMQNTVPDQYRGRVFGARGTTFALLTLFGMAIGGWLGDLVGIVPVINIQGTGLVLAGLLALVLLPRHEQHFSVLERA